MKIVPKIICRTVGAAGIGAAVYDAAKIAGQFSKIGGEEANEKYLEKVYYDSRTTDNVSYNENLLREKTFQVRSKLVLPALIGKIKGGVKGFMYGLGNYLPVVICSTLALTCKNWAAKAGAIGVGAAAIFSILRNGFGVGKEHPMN